eukprot:2391310-Amphidinium_carterae.1
MGLCGFLVGVAGWCESKSRNVARGLVAFSEGGTEPRVTLHAHPVSAENGTVQTPPKLNPP